VQERGVARLNAVAGTMRPVDRLGVVAFGGDAVVERRSEGRTALAPGGSAVVDSDTNIARAIGLATELLPSGGTRRLLLYSDGHETAGDARAAALSAAVAGIPLDVLPPDFTGVHMAPVVTSVAAPSGARIDEPFPLSVDVHGDPGAKARLGIYRDGALLATRDLRMSPAGEAVATFEDRQTEAGVHAYRAAIEDSGDDFDEERAAGSGALVAVSGVPTVLYVTTSVGALPPVLQSGGFRVTRVVPGSVPAALSALTAYDAVVLDDVAATSLAAAQLSSLAHYVEDTGGGLLVLGSPRTLDLAGYPTTALGRLLPVDLRPRSGQRAPALGLVLVFDKSGSMADMAGGTPKIDIARQAVMRVLDVLPQTDSLGVIAFDREPVVVTPLVSPPSARAIADRLRDVDAGGQTRIAPAATLALRWLGDTAGTSVSRREILLLSDGRTTPDDADILRRAVAGTGVHVSTVAIGSNADRALLTELANSTGGRAYFPDNVADLPMVVSRAATRSSAATVVTEHLALRGGSHPALAGIALDALPRVDGYVVAGLKPTATAVLSSQLGDPVLCGWKAGLGRVLVFTGDLGSPWSDPLRRWTDYARLWRQSVRWVSRQSDDPSLHLTIAERDGRMRVVIDAEEATGRYLHLVAPVMTVRPPVGEARPVVVVAEAPGRYDAETDAASPGPYVIEVSARDADTGLDHRVVRGFYLSASREQERRGNDVGLLSGLAAATGGRVLGPTDSPFAHTRPLEFVDVSPWALSIVLALFLIDLLSRSTVAEALSRWLHARGGWSAWNAPAA
jgi:Mg-chelatase subunit ChlD